MCQVSFTMTNVNECEVAQSCPTLCYSMNTRLLRPCDFLGKSTEVGCHFLLQGIFRPQGSNLGLLHCRQMLFHLSPTQAQFLGQEDSLEETVITHSSILAWRNPWTEEPGGLQSRGLQIVGHDLMTKQQFYYLKKINLIGG